jgi:hypothetical protein
MSAFDPATDADAAEQFDAAHFESMTLNALHMAIRDLAAIGYTRDDFNRLLSEALAPRVVPTPLVGDESQTF